MIKIQGNPGLVKDRGSKAVINVDSDQYQAALNRRMSKNKLESRLSKMEQEIKMLKELLTKQDK